MRVGIHQPHYFPWAGWFNKMHSVDKFVLLDEVQLEKGSFMYRNRILNDRGQIRFLTISANKHGFLDKKYNEIRTLNDEEFLRKHSEEIKRSYGKTAYFNEIWEQIGDLFEDKVETICEYCVRSIFRLKEMLGIDTEIIMQSSLDIDDSWKRNELVIGICKTLGADEYISGNGARKYNDEDAYGKEQIKLTYQNYTMPEYKQISSEVFVPGLSVLDTLFNCGVIDTKRIILGDDHECLE